LTKVLVLGATGMLGHKLYQKLGEVFEVIGTIRGDYQDIEHYGFYRPEQIVPCVNALQIETVARAINKVKPDVVVNCIGVVKSLVDETGSVETMQLNALLPHQLYELCLGKPIRLIHISTDCVFSGKKGNYSEDDPSDAEDEYGQTKFLGEIADGDTLTLRTSIIGPELEGSNGLLEWFIDNRNGKVRGYTNAIFSGFPTLHMAGIIGDIIKNHRDLTGLYHVASEPISKYDLLALINQALSLNIVIDKSPEVRIDRSLDGARFRADTGFEPLPWDKMIADLAADVKAYERWS
jgi:dTDP-4-dehydrorhamnose reductase